MGKGRFTALDVYAIVTPLRKLLIGTRVANIYDLNSRTYLLKFSGKDVRKFLILESGIRCHCSAFIRSLPSMPNHFASKLRKYLRSKKLTDIHQIGRDRIIEFTFGSQEIRKLHLIIEMFGSGNIILCDFEHTVLLALRVNDTVQHGEKYKFREQTAIMFDKQSISQQFQQSIARLLQQQKEKQKQKQQSNNKIDESKMSNRQKRKQRMNQPMENIGHFIVKVMSTSPLVSHSIAQRFGVDLNESLLNYVDEESLKQLQEEMLCDDSDESDSDSDDDEQKKSNEMDIESITFKENKFELLMQCFKEYENYLSLLTQNDYECKGYIISKSVSLKPQKKINVFVKKARSKTAKPVISLQDEDDENNDNKSKKNEQTKEQKQQKLEEEESKKPKQFVYDEFIPYAVTENDALFNKKGNNKNITDIKILTFNTFNESVDEFYSNNEANKQEMQQTRAEMLAFKKLETAKEQHESRILELDAKAKEHTFYANIIEENLGLVDKAINGVNTLLADGIDWNDLGKRIREETQYGNPIASIIVALKLHEGLITLRLKHEVEIEKKFDAYDDDQNEDDDDDDADEDNEQVTEQKVEFYKIDVELRLSAWQNAQKYHILKKQLLDKMDKTLDATTKALKAAESKTKIALKEAKQTAQIEKLRKIYWFEKFYWFISSDNFLIIAGRDAQQNEIIVKKYMDKKKDIYVHALIHGASSVIIKNPNGIDPIPLRTLTEAGAMCVCRSKAWNTNVSVQSYWVYGKQVSKTPETGQYLPTGSFVIRGKRNFIEAQALQMGIVLLFRIDEKSQMLYHKSERQMKYLDDEQPNNKDKGDENEKGNEEEQKKNNTIFITRTMVQSDLKAKREFEQQKGNKKDGNDNENDANENENDNESKSKKKNITNKKLAKYGFVDEKNGDDKSDNLQKKKQRKKNKKVSYKKARLYDEKDLGLVKQLLGIKDEEKEENEEKNDVDEQRKEELRETEPKEGYALNANPVILGKNQALEPQANGSDDDNNSDNEEELQHKEEMLDEQRRVAISNRLEDELRLLTGNLHENDTVLYCMVMCAPYICVKDYEYKIKIEPGTTKRGKAIKYVQELFLAHITAKKNQMLLALYKAIKDTELSHVFLSDVRISGQGVNALKSKQKKMETQKQKEKWKQKQRELEKLQSKNKQSNPSANPKKRKKK